MKYSISWRPSGHLVLDENGKEWATCPDVTKAVKIAASLEHVDMEEQGLAAKAKYEQEVG